MSERAGRSVTAMEAAMRNMLRSEGWKYIPTGGQNLREKRAQCAAHAMLENCWPDAGTDAYRHLCENGPKGWHHIIS